MKSDTALALQKYDYVLYRKYRNDSRLATQNKISTLATQSKISTGIFILYNYIIVSV